jgi:hypothetical protein
MAGAWGFAASESDGAAGATQHPSANGRSPGAGAQHPCSAATGSGRQAQGAGSAASRARLATSAVTVVKRLRPIVSHGSTAPATGQGLRLDLDLVREDQLAGARVSKRAAWRVLD